MNDLTLWHNCYSGSWNGILVPDAFAHPAKVAPGLSYRIYRHMLDAGYIVPGDSVFDPFGGIGGFGYHAMLLGLHWTGVELEPRFVELGQRNIDKWRRDLAMLNGTLGTARLLQGDSRRLLEVVGGGMGAAVSSPPYSGDALGHDAGTVRLDKKEDDRRATEGAFRRPGYGATPGNVGNMRDGGFEGATERNEWLDSATLALFDVLSGAARERAQEEEVDNFWSAARAIVEQTYAALRPGGYAAWVTKCFVRKGAIVPFSDQWEQLCAAVGFTPVERIYAMLVDDHGEQLDIFGGATARRKERKSFFRRLAEKKGSPRIDHEDVIIMRKPTRAHANGNGARSEP